MHTTGQGSRITTERNTLTNSGELNLDRDRRSGLLGTISPTPSIQNLTDVVTRFPTVRTLVLGDCILDTYISGSARRLSRDAPVPVVDSLQNTHRLGGAANVAANLYTLGCPVALVSVVGRDDAGSTIKSLMEELGIDCDWLLQDGTVQTPTKSRLVGDGQILARFDGGSISPRSRQSDDALLQHIKHLLPTCDVLLISDYGIGTLSEYILTELSASLKIHSCVVVVDAKDVLKYRHFPIDVATPSLDEALRALEITERNCPISNIDFTQLGNDLLNKTDCKSYIVTLAEHGAVTCEPNKPCFHVPAMSTFVADDIGAGDTFAAATALSVAAGATLEQAACISVRAASVAVSKQWTATVSHFELLRHTLLGLDFDTSLQPSLRELSSILARIRFNGGQIVFTNGVFDILHFGHVRLLQYAKSRGDFLIVGINSDESTRRLKGSTRPINPERARAALLAALEVVDLVLIFEEDSPSELIKMIMPDVYVKGGDYRPENLPEYPVIQSLGTRIEFAPLEPGFSTTRLIRSMSS